MHATVSEIIIIILIRQVTFLVTVRVVRNFPKDLSLPLLSEHIYLSQHAMTAGMGVLMCRTTKSTQHKRGRRRQCGAFDKAGAQTGYRRGIAEGMEVTCNLMCEVIYA